MSLMQGVVQEVSTRDVSTKFGVKPTYSFKVDGKWVKHGFKDPRVTVGDMVEFDGVEGKYGMEGTNVKKVGAATASVTGLSLLPPGRPLAPPAYSGKVFPLPALHGDRSIVRQNALARATDLVIAAHGGKPFAMDKVVADACILYARRFEAYTAGDLDMEEAVAEAKAASDGGAEV